MQKKAWQFIGKEKRRRKKRKKYVKNAKKQVGHFHWKGKKDKKRHKNRKKYVKNAKKKLDSSLERKKGEEKA